MVNPAYMVQVPSISHRAGKANMAGGKGATVFAPSVASSLSAWNLLHRTLIRNASKQSSSPKNIPAACDLVAHHVETTQITSKEGFAST